ncbi:DUF3667 domain-containing protein [soil metagenome]
MSHFKERKEKNCLNCNAEVYGTYCHICGQENIEPKESFWSLVTHFVYDLMHFDGKFFSTLKYLLFKPGFLSQEYLRGKRQSYLHPVRMYVFTSAVFFIIFFSFIINPVEIGESIKNNEEGVSQQVHVLKDSLQKAIRTETDSAQKQKLDKLLNAISNYNQKGNDITVDSLLKQKPGQAKIKTCNDTLNICFSTEDGLPSTITEYDSLQQLLPEKDRDGWFVRIIKHRGIEINEKYHNDQRKFLDDFLEKFFHSFPQIMFVTLPLIALIMQLLYIRQRKQVFYVNHVVFITHVYIALFICLLIRFGISALYDASGFSIFKWINFLVGVYIFIYCPWAMIRFYKQGKAKTIFKYFILLFISLILFGIVFTLFAIKSFL